MHIQIWMLCLRYPTTRLGRFVAMCYFFAANKVNTHWGVRSWQSVRSRFHIRKVWHPAFDVTVTVSFWIVLLLTKTISSIRRSFSARSVLWVSNSAARFFQRTDRRTLTFVNRSHLAARIRRSQGHTWHTLFYFLVDHPSLGANNGLPQCRP